MRKTTATERGFLTGCFLTLICGFLLTWQADREGIGLQPTADVPHPWLHGIAVNGMCVGVFLVPLATVFGKWIGDYLAWQSRKKSLPSSNANDDSAAIDPLLESFPTNESKQ